MNLPNYIQISNVRDFFLFYNDNLHLRNQHNINNLNGGQSIRIIVFYPNYKIRNKNIAKCDAWYKYYWEYFSHIEKLKDLIWVYKKLGYFPILTIDFGIEPKLPS